jgi:hypothetical protein
MNQLQEQNPLKKRVKNSLFELIDKSELGFYKSMVKALIESKISKFSDDDIKKIILDLIDYLNNLIDDKVSKTEK